MPTATASVKYRPLRVGFLVRPAEITDIRSAAQLNTLLWGGKYNPMIPVSADGVADQKLVDAFGVDMLVASTKVPEIEAALKRHPFLTNRHAENELLFEDWTSKKQVVALLDSLCIIERYWHEEFRHTKPGNEQSNCALLEWDATDELADCLTLDFGSYPKHLNLRDDFADAFEHGLRARKLTVALDGPVPSEMSQLISPCSLTGLDLRTYGGSFMDLDGVFLGDPKKASDLLSFWNLRAQGAAIHFIPRGHVERYEGFLRVYLEAIDARGPHPSTRDQMTAIHFTDCPEAERQAFLQKFRTKRQMYVSSVREGDHEAYGWRPSQHYLSWDQAMGFIEPSSGAPSITLGLPEKKFVVESRHRNRRTGMDLLAVSVDFHSDDSFEGYTLRPPYLRSLNEFYGRRIVGHPWDLRCEREGIALVIRLHQSNLYLQPLSHQVLIERLFELAGIGAEVSQPGRLTRTIIKGMREQRPLDACRVFKVRGVRKLLGRMTAEDVVSCDEAIKDIGSEEFGSFKDLFIEARKKRELEPQDVLRFLLKKRILRPVVRVDREKMADFRCIECGLTTEIQRGSFEGNWQCPYCAQPHFMPEQVMSVPRACLPWEAWGVCKAGLFAKENNQEGAVPVVLTLMTLLRVFELGRFVYSPAMDLRLDAKTKCETDLVVLQYRHQDDAIELGIGECKSPGGRIDSDDISKLKAVRARTEAVGLTTYLIFGKTVGSFEADEIELFRELWREGIPTVLFTNRELEPYHPFWKDADDQLPDRHPSTLAALAKNSLARYLGVPKSGVDPKWRRAPVEDVVPAVGTDHSR